MAFSVDADLTAIQPDILTLGITSFAGEHAKAEADIKREIRNRWWIRTGRGDEMDPLLLVDAQWNRANSYLVLWKYALPQLSNWVGDDRFLNMINFYRDLYNQEFEAVLNDGVQYDFDQDGTIQDSEQDLFVSGRLNR